MKLISIIIPVYNVEKYLDRCIKSVLNQTYKNIEIILVDDGSPDNCPKICDDWAKKDDRIKVIHKENGGLGYARNSGLEIATGEYVLFIDSDDYIDSNLLSDIIANIEKYGECDLFTFGYRKVDDKGDLIMAIIPNTPQIQYIDNEVQEVLLPELLSKNPYNKNGYGLNTLSSCCWAYKLSTMRKSGVKFISEREIISEDVYFLLKLMAHIKSVVVINKGYYNYYQNNSSLTKCYKEERYEKTLDFYKKALQLCEENNYSEEVKFRLNDPLLTMLLSCLKSEVSFIKENGFTFAYKNIKKILEDETLQRALKLYPSKQFSKTRQIAQFCMKKKWICPLMLIIRTQMFFMKVKRK